MGNNTFYNIFISKSLKHVKLSRLVRKLIFCSGVPPSSGEQ